MALTAVYASTTSFTVSGDKTGDFVPGIAVYCDCGTDGIKYGYVNYSSYSSPDTTVYLESSESQAITSNLESVLFSRVKFKETGGNAPLQVVWMHRGFKSGLALSYKDADEIYVDSGALHIDDGTAENIYCAQSQITKQLTSLSTSTWYAIYVDPPDNGLNLVAADIEYSSTMPEYSQVKRGWYHPTNTDWRCIGIIFSNASSQVAPFSVHGREWVFQDSRIRDADGTQPSDTWTDVTISLPMGSMVGLFRIANYYVGTGAEIAVRTNGTSGDGLLGQWIDSNSRAGCMHILMLVDADKKIEWKFSKSTTNTAYCDLYGFLVPNGM